MYACLGRPDAVKPWGESKGAVAEPPGWVGLAAGRRVELWLEMYGCRWRGLGLIEPVVSESSGPGKKKDCQNSPNRYQT